MRYPINKFAQIEENCNKLFDFKFLFFPSEEDDAKDEDKDFAFEVLDDSEFAFEVLDDSEFKNFSILST